MNVKLKDGRILPIEENSLIALNDNGETLEVNVDEIESVECDGIDWEKVRINASIAIMQGQYSSKDIVLHVCRTCENPMNELAESAVRQADALIAELKKEGE